MRTLRWIQICPDGEKLHIAHSSAPQPVNWARHDHDFFECFLVESGRGYHLLETGKYEITDGNLIFLRPEDRHGLESSPWSSSNSLGISNIAFEANLIHEFMERHRAGGSLWSNKGTEPTVFQLHGSEKQQLINLIENVAHGGRSAIDAEYFLSALYRILHRDNQLSRDDNSPDWLRHTLLLMREPENLSQGSQRLFELCGRSREHVSRQFRIHLGISPVQWLDNLRIQHARRLLETTRMSVLEIALECGMPNQSHFHQRFKKQAGMTPLKYRQKHRRAIAGVQ